MVHGIANARWPYWLVFGYFALGCLQLLATVVSPPLPTTNVGWQAVMLVACFVLLVAAGAVTILAHRPGALVLLIMGGLLLIGFTTAGAAGGQGQLMTGAYLTLLGLIAGLTLTRRWLITVVVTGSVVYLGGTLVNPLVDTNSYSIGMAALFVVVAVVVFDLFDRLGRQATRDPLTGVLNRRGIEMEGSAAHYLDMRAGRDTTVVELDLDGFKSFNDVHGHAAGDRLLSELSASWNSVLRRTDLLGRIGGDEFVVVLPATTREQSQELVTRLRGAHETHWTAGISSWTCDESIWDALGRADTSLYAQKRAHSGSRTSQADAHGSPTRPHPIDSDDRTW